MFVVGFYKTLVRILIWLPISQIAISSNNSGKPGVPQRISNYKSVIKFSSLNLPDVQKRCASGDKILLPLLIVCGKNYSHIYLLFLFHKLRKFLIFSCGEYPLNISDFNICC